MSKRAFSHRKTTSKCGASSPSDSPDRPVRKSSRLARQDISYTGIKSPVRGRQHSTHLPQYFQSKKPSQSSPKTPSRGGDNFTKLKSKPSQSPKGFGDNLIIYGEDCHSTGSQQIGDTPAKQSSLGIKANTLRRRGKSLLESLSEFMTQCDEPEDNTDVDTKNGLTDDNQLDVPRLSRGPELPVAADVTPVKEPEIYVKIEEDEWDDSFGDEETVTSDQREDNSDMDLVGEDDFDKIVSQMDFTPQVTETKANNHCCLQIGRVDSKGKGNHINTENEENDSESRENGVIAEAKPLACRSSGDEEVFDDYFDEQLSQIPNKMFIQQMNESLNTSSLSDKSVRNGSSRSLASSGLMTLSQILDMINSP